MNKKINILPVKVTRDLKITDYNHLLKESELIERKYRGFVGNEKQCRNLKRKMNAVSRQLNNLRKKKAKPYRASLHQFKANIDALRVHIKNVSKVMNKQLKVYQKKHDDWIKRRCQPEWDQICIIRGLNKSPVPDDIIARRSYTRKNRTDLMVGIANRRRLRLQLDNAIDVNEKAVNVDDNGEIKPIKHALAKRLTFLGTRLQWQELMEFAKQNRIHLKQK